MFVFCLSTWNLFSTDLFSLHCLLLSTCLAEIKMLKPVLYSTGAFYYIIMYLEEKRNGADRLINVEQLLCLSSRQWKVLWIPYTLEIDNVRFLTLVRGIFLTHSVLWWNCPTGKSFSSIKLTESMGLCPGWGFTPHTSLSGAMHWSCLLDSGVDFTPGLYMSD